MNPYDPAKDFLQSVHEVKTEIRRLGSKIAQLDAQVQRTTPTLSGMPHGGNADAQKAWATLADLRTEYVSKLAWAEMAELEVSDFIDRIPTQASRVVLRHRYLECRRWESVQKIMAAEGQLYELRSIFKIHGKALNEARALWAAEHEGEIEDE